MCGHLGSQADPPLTEDTLYVWGTDMESASLLIVLFTVTLPPDVETEPPETTGHPNPHSWRKGEPSEQH